MRHMSEAIKPS